MRDTWRATTLAAIFVTAALGAATADAPEATDFHLSFGKAEAVAIRFNLTPGSDLRIEGTMWSCHNSTAPFESTVGNALFTISDSSSSYIHSIRPGSFAWGAPGSEIAAAGIEGHRVTGPNLIDESLCAGMVVVLTAKSNRANESLTVLMLNMAPVGWADLHANWTRNVTGFDVAPALGVARTKDDFDHGAHASVYPLPTGVSAGALLRTDVLAPHGFIGYFTPAAFGSAGVTEYTCTISSAACPPVNPFGAVPIHAPRASNVTIEIDLDARAGENPYYAFGGVVLPSAGYLD